MATLKPPFASSSLSCFRLPASLVALGTATLTGACSGDSRFNATGEPSSLLGGAAGADAAPAEPGGESDASSTPDACDDICKAAAFCDEASATCVECVDADDCDGDTSLCNTKAGECVACLEDADCKNPSAPVCDNGACTGCTDEDDCSRFDGAHLCDLDTQACVECLEQSDCVDPEAPVCDDGACTGCADEGDCSRFDSTPVCNAKAQACVECTDESHCDGKVCDPAAGTCTTLTAHEVRDCGACEYDAQCQLNQLCVEHHPDPGDGVEGTYCSWKKDASPGPEGTCPSSSSRQAEVTSVDGVVATICEPKTTSCVAILVPVDPSTPD